MCLSGSKGEKDQSDWMMMGSCRIASISPKNVQRESTEAQPQIGIGTGTGSVIFFLLPDLTAPRPIFFGWRRWAG